MAVLYHLLVQNFRGIEKFEHYFSKGVTCIIGRGDSGKSTILEAINYVFSSSWGLHLNDSDFYMCNTDVPIVIEGTIKSISEKLISKYSSHIRAILPNGELCDDLEHPDSVDSEVALTIRLTVTKDLEPVWEVVAHRSIDPIPIKASDRSALNVFSISDFTDRHFSLNKGNPLYTLYKQLSGEDLSDDGNHVLEVIRDAKKEFDISISDKFTSVMERIKNLAGELGISLNEIKASLDHKDIAISENKVSIHEDGIPFRLKGKGSKRLLSLAIQLSLTQPSGIILIDEIEQGLEPDRVQHLVAVLSRYDDKQIVMTTHSSNVIVEIPCNSLYVKRKDVERLAHVDNALQAVVRANPEAFFAKKVLVCEGATEVGICRAINEYRCNKGKPSASCLGVRFADGTGRGLSNYVEGFVQLGYSCCLFCDSDDNNINDKKEHFKQMGVEVVDCEDNLCLEEQILKNIPWNAVKDLISLYKGIKIRTSEITDDDAKKAIYSSVMSKMSVVYSINSENWLDQDSIAVRNAIGKASSKNSWFKNQDGGQILGTIALQNYDQLDIGCCLKKELDDIIKWIES